MVPAEEPYDTEAVEAEENKVGCTLLFGRLDDSSGKVPVVENKSDFEIDAVE